MNDHELLMNLIKDNLDEMRNTIDCLYTAANSCTKNIMLNRLRKNISNLSMLTQSLQNNQAPSISQNEKNPQLNPTRVFNKTELSKYNGKNGNPAYVAVNGTVYNVTNNAAWAAATHFGLTAGRDLTGEFSTCHSGQPILSRLPIVGEIAN